MDLLVLFGVCSGVVDVGLVVLLGCWVWIDCGCACFSLLRRTVPVGLAGAGAWFVVAFKFCSVLLWIMCFDVGWLVGRLGCGLLIVDFVGFKG